MATHGFVLAALGLVMLLSVHCASVRPLWTDEYLSLKLARADDLGELWYLLATGPQSDPPLFYLAACASMAVFGDNPVAFRLPSVAGGMLLGLALYVFAVRRYPPAYARLALLYPLLPPALLYTYEARPYGLWLGFSGLSLLCWQIAGDSGGWKRWLAVLGLAACTMAAVSTHYYAVLFVAALALAQVARVGLRRRLDLPVWVALAAAAGPLLAFRPLIANASTFIDHSWAAPVWIRLVYTYDGLFTTTSAGALYVVLAIVAISALLSRRDAEPRAGGFRSDEAIAGVAIAALPVLGMLLAQLYTNNYTMRYALPAVCGFAILVVAAAQRAGGPRHWPGNLLAALTLLLVVNGYRPHLRANDDPTHLRLNFSPIARAATERARHAGLLLVTDNLHAFVCGKSLDEDKPLIYACSGATGNDPIARKVRSWWGNVLEPPELLGQGRFLLVPALDEGNTLETKLWQLGARFTPQPPLPGGEAVIQVEMPACAE